MRVVYVCSLRMLCTLVYVCSVCLWCICFKSFLRSILNVQHDTDFRKPESLEQKRGFSICVAGGWVVAGGRQNSAHIRSSDTRKKDTKIDAVCPVLL